MAIYDIDGNPITSGGDSGKVKTRLVSNPNLADPDKFVIGLLNANGTINTAQAGCVTTDFIPCTAGQIVSAGMIMTFNHNPFFVCTGFREVSRARVFYDANKTVVSGVSENYNSSDNVMNGLTAPNNTAYVRISFGGANVPSPPVTYPERCFVHIASAPTTAVEMFYSGNAEKIEATDSQTWEKWGQTWTMFGDSLTDSYGGHSWDESTSPVGGEGWKDTEDRVPWTGYFWASDIARRHGYIMDNRAKSGSNIYVSRVYTDVSGVYILDAFLAELEAGTIEEPDLITVGFGANSVPDEIGTNSDTSATTNTLYGGTKYFIEKLNEKCPNARKIYILHPLQTGWRDTDGTARAAMKTVFDAYNVEYVDMSMHSGITTDMLPDGLHVSSIEANKQYGRFLESYMM